VRVKFMSVSTASGVGINGSYLYCDRKQYVGFNKQGAADNLSRSSMRLGNAQRECEDDPCQGLLPRCGIVALAETYWARAPSLVLLYTFLHRADKATTI